MSDTLIKEPSSLASIPNRARSPIVTGLVWLESLLAVGAFAGGVGFITGGFDLGPATARLPFGSLVLAGVALILVNGILPASVAIAALRRKRWSRAEHLVVGVALMAWILVQVAVLGPPIMWLQVVFFIWGMAIVALATQLRR